MILSDIHMHSELSADSDASMEKMIECSINKGLKYISFTEHLDIDYPKEYELDFSFDLDKYFDIVSHYKQKYCDQITILYGIEIGMMPHLSEMYNSIISSYNFDFVICSSHLVDKKDPYYPDFWNNKSFDEGCRQYFHTIIDNINSYKNFDSYGHLDYITRYGKNKKYIEFDKFEELITDILYLLIENKKSLEINAAGYKYGQDSPNPTKQIIIKYLELGGRLFTIGADAHKPEHIAYSYDKLEKLLKECGVKEYAVYKNRIPELIKL